jgi:ABC-type oligopeptide transport system substrate-binding subunit
VAKADVILDPAVRKLEYEKAEAMLMQGIPVLPLTHYSANALVKPYVDGYVSPTSGAQEWGMFGRIKILAHDQE